MKAHENKQTNKQAGKSTRPCQRCDGNGMIMTTQRMGPVMFQKRMECNACSGMGYKLNTEKVTIDVRIPIGGKNGETVTGKVTSIRITSLGMCKCN